MERFSNQLRQVIRRLARTPIFTAITAITLAAGIGANTAVFSVLEGALLKPLPYRRADRLVGRRRSFAACLRAIRSQIERRWSQANWR